MANSATSNNPYMNIPELIKIINDRSVIVYLINEDIEKLQQALKDLDKAHECFRKSSEEIKELEAEVNLIFKGRSSDAFLKKVHAYKKYCDKRKESLVVLKGIYTKKLADLYLQKAAAERLTNKLNDLLAKMRNAEIKGV